jgi:hypothetical protein
LNLQAKRSTPVRVLLDESVPRPWKRDIPEHEVVHVADLGWQGVKNGELLRRATSQGFAVLVTTDGNIEHQQNLSDAGLGIVIVRTVHNRIQELQPLAAALLEALRHPARRGSAHRCLTRVYQYPA